MKSPFQSTEKKLFTILGQYRKEENTFVAYVESLATVLERLRLVRRVVEGQRDDVPLEEHIGPIGAFPDLVPRLDGKLREELELVLAHLRRYHNSMERGMQDIDQAVAAMARNVVPPELAMYHNILSTMLGYTQTSLNAL